jgi:hypothetical protein
VPALLPAKKKGGEKINAKRHNKRQNESHDRREHSA